MSPSSHSPSLAQHAGMPVCWQPVPGSQVSAVQTARSSQSRSASSWQPFVASQLSAPSQTSPLSQLSGVPGRQLPVASSQVSVPVQTL